jgi:transcriptional regulator with XRE-family HTH domain
MKFEITKEWLARKLAQADDTAAGAGGTDFEQLKKETEGRTVTLTVFAETRSELGKVVRFIREQRGWSRQELADIAMINADDVAAIETQADYSLPPRAVIYLADALGLSRNRLQELVGHVIRRDTPASNDTELRYAANSKGVRSISKDEFDAVRALVEVLTEKKRESE